jgi:hypothetical protein
MNSKMERRVLFGFIYPRLSFIELRFSDIFKLGF